jgi:hypothetical protein
MNVTGHFLNNLLQKLGCYVVLLGRQFLTLRRITVTYSHSTDSVLVSAALNIFLLYAYICLPEDGSTRAKHVAVSD